MLPKVFLVALTSGLAVLTILFFCGFSWNKIGRLRSNPPLLSPNVKRVCVLHVYVHAYTPIPFKIVISAKNVFTKLTEMFRLCSIVHLEEERWMLLEEIKQYSVRVSVLEKAVGLQEYVRCKHFTVKLSRLFYVGVGFWGLGLV
jgi:hypothetical protein